MTCATGGFAIGFVGAVFIVAAAVLVVWIEGNDRPPVDQ